MTTDILFVSWNRRAFTELALRCLIENTDWGYADRLVIYDNGSDDGAREAIDAAIVHVPVPVELVSHAWHSPVEVMSRYLHELGADVDTFAKIDNDVAVPPGWLRSMLSVYDRDNVSLLGMEAGMTQVAGRDGDDAWNGVYRFEPSTHIGGIGLMRRSAFDAGNWPLKAHGQRNGFTEWQHQNRPRRGWITPDLPVVLLDRLPIDPWRSLSARYEELGWQRPWPKWDPVWMRWAYEWLLEREGIAA